MRIRPTKAEGYDMSEFYKDQRQVELKVGIIVIVTLLILVFGYAWLRNLLQIKSMSELKIKFANTQGIQIGDKVTVNGMEAGKVGKITQLQDGVLLECMLKLKYPLRQGCRFIIQDSNLMGGKQMEIINAATGSKLDLSQIQSGEIATGMTTLMSEIGIAMVQVQKILVSLNQPDGVIASVSSTLSETEKAVKNVNGTLDANKDKLAATLKHLETSTRQLSQLLAEHKTEIDRTAQLTPQVMSKANATLDSLQIASQTLQAAIREITQGKGTLPKLISDEKLYNNLLKTTGRMDSLLIDVKKNPTRYFKLKVF
jgi:phospholipid/cholesterol/gamma-HCH transport system substrate-binding protein